MNIDGLVIEGKQLKGTLNAWVSPKGVVYKMDQMAMHEAFADEWLFKHLGGGDLIVYMAKYDEERDRLRCQFHFEVLIKLGWVRLSTWTRNFVTFTASKPDTHLTHAQRQAIKEWEMWNPGIRTEWLLG